MAVQKSRKTRSARGMRRSHDSIAGPTLSEDQVTGEVHRRHHVTASGFYKGKNVLNLRKKQVVESDEE